MATYHTEVRRHAQRQDGTYNVKLRITHHRTSRWLPTSITATDADLTARGRIKSQRILDLCEDLLRSVRQAAATLSPFALEDMSVDDLAAFLRSALGASDWRLDFFGWGRDCIAGMTPGARGNYTRALNALARFLGRTEIDINALRAADIRAFGDWLDAEPKQHGTGRAGEAGSTRTAKVRGGVSASYVRSLARLHALARARYNDPDAERLLIPRNPFDGYGTRPAPPRGGQSSLGVAGIQAMIDALPDADWLHAQALALALLSFCLMGANIADLYRARPPKGDWWVYRRKKVEERKGKDAEVRVRLTREARMLAGLLADRSGVWWLGLHNWGASAERVDQTENRRLRSWQKRQGCEDFTFYAVRHSWGTIAGGVGVGAEIDRVDQALGHNGSLRLANIYIEKDWPLLNDINARVLGLFDWRGLEKCVGRP